MAALGGFHDSMQLISCGGRAKEEGLCQSPASMLIPEAIQSRILSLPLAGQGKSVNCSVGASGYGVLYFSVFPKFLFAGLEATHVVPPHGLPTTTSK